MPLCVQTGCAKEVTVEMKLALDDVSVPVQLSLFSCDEHEGPLELALRERGLLEEEH
jgi:hypothetical protein